MITKALQQEAEILENELIVLEGKRQRLDLIHQLLRTYKTDGHPELFQKVNGENTKYSSPSLTNTVIQLFRDNPDRLLQPRDVREIIIQGGFKTDSKNLIVMITSICKRKTDEGILHRGEKNGYHAYKIKAS